MLVSVIIPVYNVATFLPQTIESVLRQTFRNLEVLIVNDGSTDSSLSVIMQYAKTDRRIKVINKPNGGVGSARNAALEICRGEYVLFLDGDDVWNTCLFVENLVMAVKRSHLDMVIFPMSRFYVNDYGQMFLERNNTKYHNICPVCECNPTREPFPISACRKFIKRQLLIDNKLFFCEDLLGEDMEWTLRLLSVVKSVGDVTNSIYWYRIRKGSITGSFSFNNADNFCTILQNGYRTAPYGDMGSFAKRLIALWYMTLVADVRLLTKKERRLILKKVSDLQYVLRGCHDKKVVIFRGLSKCLGFSVALRLWGIVVAFKNKIRRFIWFEKVTFELKNGLL